MTTHESGQDGVVGSPTACPPQPFVGRYASSISLPRGTTTTDMTITTRGQKQRMECVGPVPFIDWWVGG
jgi:hypothetical protein